jgi:hypothetical protein
MKQFLQVIEPLIPAVQAQRIAGIVQKRKGAGSTVSSVEVQEEIQRLLQLVRQSGTFEPAFKARTPQLNREVMHGDEFNARMEELQIDLQTLFDIANAHTGTTVGLQKILRNKVECLRAAISRLADDLISYQQLKHTDGFARVITQGFADGRNLSKSGVAAKVDAQTRTLKLPTTRQERYHQRRGITPAQVNVTNLSAGLTDVVSRTFAKENAIDPDQESFWAEVLLSSAPLQTDYTFSSGAVETFDGAVVEVGLVLGAPEFVTDVKILPFGDFPINVIDIKYRQGSAIFQYDGFISKTPSLNWLEFHGPRVLADEVIFVLQQPSYTRVRYHIPKQTLNIASFWEQLLDEESALLLGPSDLTDFQTQRAEADSHFASLWEGLRRYGLELERRDLPAPDSRGQTVADTEVLSRIVEAAESTMTGSPANAISIKGISDRQSCPRDVDWLVEIERVEYVFGAREIQANDAQYLPEGHYESPKYAPDSSILQIKVNPVEEHPEFSDNNGAFRRTSIEYDVEIAPGRRTPVLPKGTSTVANELLVLDRVTRDDITRFTSSSTAVTIRKDGVVLPASSYTVTISASGQLKVTIGTAAFSRSSRYQIAYTPDANQDKVDVEALYNSVAIELPESFSSTDDRGAIELQHYPFVEYSVVNDSDLFQREAERSAKWFWIGGRQQEILDGFMYADANTAVGTAGMTSSQTSVVLTDVSNISSSGKLKIGTEIMSYTGVTVGTKTVTGLTRGVDGTSAQAHRAGTLIVGERIYEPLVVHVGDIKALNITSYETGQHPAFLQTTDKNLRYEYLHVGRRLFFNRPILNKTVTVRYRWMSQYIQVLATLRSHAIGRISYTPVLKRYHVEVESSVL